MRRIVPAILTLLMLASCTKQEATLSPDDAARRDSLALHVAVVPVMDCLPAFYAQHMGLYDSLGIDVRLQVFESTMDVDTALINGWAQLGYTSLPRLVMIERERKDTLHEVAELKSKLYLLTAHSKRIRNVKQLKERMLALDRHSMADYWSDLLMVEAGLDKADIYRPQFNDIKLRASMVENQLVDAAILPEPYASVVRLQGNRQIAETPDSLTHLCCLACRQSTSADSLRKVQLKGFIDAYNRAVDLLNQAPDTDTITVILSLYYGLGKETTDSLSMPKFHSTLPPSPESRKVAEGWIRERYKRD